MATVGAESPQHDRLDAELLLAHMADIVALVGGDGRWLRLSPSVEAVLGYAPAELIGRRVAAILPGADGGLFEDAPGRIELQARGRDGGLRWLEVDVNPISDDPGADRYVLTARDITERRERDEELTAEVLRDPLTGLANRAHLETVVTHALQRLRRRSGMVALLFLDLDRFKDVNDQYGHAAGDAVLIETGRRLARVLRDTDVAARLGGDEFVVCCEDLSDEAEVRIIAERTLLAVSEPFQLDGPGVLDLAVSMGVAIASEPVHPGALMADADSAMYRAKRDTSGSLAVVHTRSAAARAMTPPLEVALRRRELRIALQPIVRLGEGRVVAAETLLRWQHPGRGLVSPWAVSDELGVVDVSVPITLWVLQEVCRSLASVTGGDDGQGLDVSVNVHLNELADARFVTGLRAVADGHGIDVSRLCVEVRDGPELTSTRGRRAVASLQDAGVGLIIDGFPGPASSLTELDQLRPRAVKLTPAVLVGLEDRPQSRELLGGLASVIRSSGTVAIATGVERPEQEAFLRPLGIDLIQGHHVSRPLPSSTFIDRYVRSREPFVAPPPAVV